MRGKAPGALRSGFSFPFAIVLCAGLLNAGRLGVNGIGAVSSDASPSGDGRSDLRALLPTVQEAGAWLSEGTPQEFAGEDLYLYIDGGAEIYREYGFVEALVQEYKNREGKGLSLEIFRMTSPEGAYGMYTFKRSAKGRAVGIGTEGQLEDYYLNFWKGGLLVTLTNYGEGRTDPDELLRIALAMARKMSDEAVPPSLIGKLPETGVNRSGIRYFRGYLGFMNCYPSFGKEAYRFQEGVKGDYSSGASLFIFKCSGEQEARESFLAVEWAFQNDPKTKDLSSPHDFSFRAIDGRGKSVSLCAVKSHILVCIEDVAGSEAFRLFEQAEKKL